MNILGVEIDPTDIIARMEYSCFKCIPRYVRIIDSGSKFYGQMRFAMLKMLNGKMIADIDGMLFGLHEIKCVSIHDDFSKVEIP